ncbi:MAG: zeta toxin family protein [Planctomycetaceae bacterium]|nr:zeta toxin family protein [Planctomycetaceae bacterium]
MSSAPSKRLRMIAGPNGSGKSSIIRNLAKERSPDGVFRLNHFLNADDVERALVSTGLDLASLDIDISLDRLFDVLRSGKRIPDHHPFFTTARLDGSVLFASGGNGYLAASIVDFLREQLMERGSSFSFETVMSHRSKVEFFGRARSAGYKTYLYFVCTNSAELNVARVRSRVASGGHAVPEDKIRERYDRCLELAPEAIANSYRAYFFDNSGPEPVWLAEFDPDGNCELKIESDHLPAWFRTRILDRVA